MMGVLMDGWILILGFAIAVVALVRLGNVIPIKSTRTRRKFPHAAGLRLLIITAGSTAAPLFGQQTAAPEMMVGREKCGECHHQELKAWELSSHNNKAWSRLDHVKAGGFARAIGVTDIKGASACTQCHGTHQTLDGELTVLPGNSCESCHGGAGGADGWLAKHYDFGLGRTVDGSTTMADLLADRLKETVDHRAQRDAACADAGMNRSENTIAIAKNCLRCHLVPNEELVRAGHPISSTFELVKWSSGEVRHNFLLTPETNNEAPSNWLDEFRNGPGRTVEGRKRLTYLAGKLADLEVSLRIRSGVSSTKRGTLGDKVNDRIVDIQEELAELNIDELNAVLDSTKGVDKLTLRELTEQDKTTYNRVADAVAAAANNFMTVHASGDKLPAEIKLKSRAKGNPYDGK